MARKSKKNKPPQRPHAPTSPRPAAHPTILIARLCFAAAIALAAWLLFYTLTEKPMAGCGPGSPCDRVMGSAWAYWLNIPVSAPALAVYISLFICSLAVTSPNPNRSRRAWAFGFMGSILIVAVASWFVYLQLHVIKSVCKYCTTTHVLSLAGAILFLAKAPRPPQSASRKLALTFAGLLPFAALIAGQELAPHKINIVTLYRGSLKFDVRDVPLIGSADNKYFIVSLFDYTCPDCHDMHGKLKAAREQLKNSFSIISLPAPLDAKCNPRVRNTSPKHTNACEIARIGLALRRCSPELYQQYDDWFFSQTPIPKFEAAREHAIALAGQAALDKALADPWVTNTLKRGVDLYEQNGAEFKSYRIPQIIVGDRINFGPVRTVDELVTILNNHLFAPASPP